MVLRHPEGHLSVFSIPWLFLSFGRISPPPSYRLCDWLAFNRNDVCLVESAECLPSFRTLLSVFFGDFSLFGARSFFLFDSSGGFSSPETIFFCLSGSSKGFLRPAQHPSVWANPKRFLSDMVSSGLIPHHTIGLTQPRRHLQILPNLAISRMAPPRSNRYQSMRRPLFSPLI